MYMKRGQRGWDMKSIQTIVGTVKGKTERKNLMCSQCTFSFIHEETLNVSFGNVL